MSEPTTEEFWRWSVEQFAKKTVEELTLDLQDRFDFNVNLLLWLCWCATRYGAAPELVIRKAIDETSSWNRNVTGGLRAARRHIKNLGHADGAFTALRTEIKNAELNAEKIEQSLLLRLAEKALTPDAPDGDSEIEERARHNLATYTLLLDASRKPGFTVSLLQALIGHIFDADEPQMAREDGTP